MAGSFEHTLRAAGQGGSRGGALALGLLLLALWVAWLGWARVDVYAPALEARLEVARMPSRVAVQLGGKIVRSSCELDRWVQEGELLVELDSSVQRAELRHALTEVESLQLRIAAARSQIRAEQAKWAARGKLEQLAAEVAGHGLERARVDTSEQQALVAITRSLRAEELVAERESLGAETELERRLIQLRDASSRIDQLRASQDYDAKAHVAAIAQLERQVEDLEAQEQVSVAAADIMRARIEQAVVTAPASGRLGNVALLRAGDVVQAGDVIATVIPDDEVRVVAEFAPAAALGRVRAGQPGRVKLAGFSWTEFGMLDASVLRIAAEPRAGTVRVELALRAGSALRVPLEHGLPGAVEICVGVASPWELLLRTLGASVAQPQPAPTRELARSSGAS